MPALHKIMLVEDDADIMAITRMALEMIGGFSVAACENGIAALAAAPSERPDLILLDVMMPGLDGPATLEALRALPETARTPVIFMTAKSQAHEIAHYRALGALDVIRKPFDPVTLPDVVRRIWEGGHE